MVLFYNSETKLRKFSGEYISTPRYIQLLGYPYLRNNPTNTNRATNPANPDWPNSLMIDVRFPITLMPNIPLPNNTSPIAPMAKKDISK